MLWHYAAGGLVALAAGFMGGWQVRAWKSGADDADRVKIEIAKGRANTYKVDAESTRYEAGRAAVQVRERIVIKEVERVVQDPVFSRVCMSDDGLRILAADAAPGRPGGEPAPALPAASAPE